MGFFDRFRKPGSDLVGFAQAIGPIDALDAHDSAWLVDRVVADMAEAGALVVGTDGEGLRTQDGRTFGLSNLARLLANSPREEWPLRVDTHVTNIFSGTDVDELNGDALLAQLYPKVFYLAQLPPEMRAKIEDYAFDLAPELRILACIDTPQKTDILTSSERLHPFGGWAAVYPRLLDNLRNLPAPEHQSQDQLQVWVSEENDFFGATRILLLEELLAAADDPIGEIGALVSMPTRNMLMAYVIRERDEAVIGATRLANLTAHSYTEYPGPLTPHLYYQAASETSLQQLTRQVGEKLEVNPANAIDAILA